MLLLWAFVLYLLLWWLALFMVLPFWTHPKPEADKTSGWRGAPENPHLWRKALVTSVIAACLWLALVGLWESGLFTFHNGAFLFAR